MKTEQNQIRPAYLGRVDQGVVVFDGAMGTALQKQHLVEKHFGESRYTGCYDYLAVSYPEAVERIHRSFLDVGVDVIETNTFRSNAVTLSEFRLSERVFEINFAAAALAASLAAEYSTPAQRRFVAGSMGPSGFLPSSGDKELGSMDFDALSRVFREQARGLLAGGVDLLLLETSQDLLEVKAAIDGCLEALEEHGKAVALQVQVTLDTNGRMLLGTDIETVLAVLEDLPVDVIGINCSTGPDQMRGPVEFLVKNSTKPVSAIPNAGMPVNRGGEAYYPMEPEAFAEALEDFARNLGVHIIGGCCGTTPEHLAALTRRVKDLPSRTRPNRRRGDFLTSGIGAVNMRQVPAPLIIGERCNPQGSGAFKKILLEENDQEASETARVQVEQGAHAIDLAAALTENRNEGERMARLVRRFTADGIDAPLVIDTTNPEVMEKALKAAPGRCLLNSTHLESGVDRANRVFSLAKRYNAAVMLLVIDEEGMAKTVERKLSLARRLYRMAVDEHGLSPGSLVFDLLTFSLATGEKEYADSALSTLKAIRELKSLFPEVYTSLGISNVSFGFGKSSRRVLNSVFLYHTVQVGLDMAIVHAAGITPYGELDQTERRLAEDLLFDANPEALSRFIEWFETRPAAREEESARSAAPGDATAVLAENILKRRRGEHIKGTVALVIGDRTGAEAADRAVWAINTVLLPAMKEVGDRFGRGEIILPFVLQSAEVMKETVDLLEKYLGKGSGPSRGRIVLATVAGDVHDIGKNLVKTILSNNGYTVVDLGKQVPVEAIVDEIETNGADALGLSALLVSTSAQMALAVKELARRNLKVPVLVGGAAINQNFADEIRLLDNGSHYSGGVYYCRDAFDGLSRLNTLRTDKEDHSDTPDPLPDGQKKLVPGKTKIPPGPIGQSSSPRHTMKAPFLGYRRLDLPLREVLELVNRRQLFLQNWGASAAAPDARPGILENFETVFTDLADESLLHGYINPRALYGFFPVLSEGDELLVLSPDDPGSGTVLQRFHLPARGNGKPSAAAGFNALGFGGYDVALFQIVTTGHEAVARFEDLQAQGEYTRGYYFHGLAAQAAEAAAEYVFRLGIGQLRMDPGGVRRISWGYPAAPELSEHEKLFKILPAAAELGMELTSAGQLVPELSTAAMMVYREQKKRSSR